ncbi:MAG: Methylase [Acidimicrobiales bacterium]|jgi:SAM-dependent methyltransferase|nr:Methylase [Acidimicrobiales bacterium]
MDDPALDAVNRRTWAAKSTLNWYQEIEGWVDDGERLALLSVADEVRGAAILDVGVGAGRTVSLLRLLSDDYLAVDYTPEMVELCRRNHPGVDVRVGDARDLDLPDGRFGLVMFSFNGLDAIDHDGRGRALRELHRVTRPGGVAILSTLNKDGSVYRRRPWHLKHLIGPVSLPALRVLITFPFRAGRYWRGFRNWRKLRTRAADRGGWAVAPLAAFDFGLLVHYSTLQQAIDDVVAAGFEVAAIFASDGSLITAGDRSATDFFELVLRRPA